MSLNLSQWPPLLNKLVSALSLNVIIKNLFFLKLDIKGLLIFAHEELAQIFLIFIHGYTLSS